MRIAVISDIHVGHLARAKDFSIEASDNGYKDDDYLAKFIAFLKLKNIKADYLTVCGDISCEAKIDELKLGSAIIDKISKALHAKKTFIVPGNHDKDWTLCNKPGDSSGYWRKKAYLPLKESSTLVTSIFNEATGDIISEPYCGIWETKDIIVAGINTSHHDTPDDKPHHGFVSDESLISFKKLLLEIEDSSKLKVLILHHHPTFYEELHPQDKDYSALQNAEKLLSMVEDAAFDIIIHGHKHVPSMKVHSSNFVTPIIYLCAGSFAARIGNVYAGSVTNSFHLIEVDNRDPKTKRVRGRIKSWSYNPIKKWSESIRSRDSINHIFQFGCHNLRIEIQDEVKSCLSDLFTKSNIVKVSQLNKTYPSLDYINVDLARAVLDDLSRDIGFEIFDNPNETLLLKI